MNAPVVDFLRKTRHGQAEGARVRAGADRAQFGKGTIMRLGDGRARGRGDLHRLARPRHRARRRRPARAASSNVRPESGKTTLALHVVAEAQRAAASAPSSTRSTRSIGYARKLGRRHRRSAGVAAGLRRAGAGDHRDAGALGRGRRHRRRLGRGADAARGARGRDGRHPRRAAGAPDEPGAAQADRHDRRRTRWSSSSTRSG